MEEVARVSQGMQHIVLFRFPRALSEPDEREMWEQVRAWPKEIPGFTRLQLGKDVGGRSGGYQYLLLTEFESEEAMRAYFPHPVHQRFSDWVFSRDCEVLRFDYPLDAESALFGG